MNESLNIYRQKIIEFQQDFIKLEKKKVETLFDNIQRSIIFETACDMNNKYDTKGFQTLLESISVSSYLGKINLKRFDN